MAICEHCKKEYEPTKPYQKYCSDACRKRAFADRKMHERKKPIEADKGRTQRPQQSMAYSGGISEADPRRRLVKMRSQGLLTSAYWELFWDVDKQFHNGTGTVNGISTKLPNFVEAVLVQIELDGVIQTKMH